MRFVEAESFSFLDIRMRLDPISNVTFSLNIYGLMRVFSLTSALISVCSAAHATDMTSLTVRVAKSNGSRQCEPVYVSSEAMKKELLASGIDVRNSLCANDGLAHPAVCGGATGQLNIYAISKAQINDALALGFSLLSDYPKAEKIICPG